MRRIFIAIVLISLLAPSIANAWNETGHATVALIAYRQLSDHQKQQIAAILKQHPHYKQFLSTDLPPGVSEDEWAFLKAAVWPDWIRPSRPGDRQFKDATITHFNQALWHYITIPWVPRTDAEKIDATTLPSREEPNILTALDLNLAKLKSDDATPEDKAVALCWLEHLIGDVHQPLHAISIVNTMYPNGDQGGNLFAVRANGNVMRLHGYWDELLGTSDGYGAVDFLATEIMLKPQCDPAKLPQYKSDTTFSSWADESHSLGAAVAYLNGRLRGVPYADYQDQKLTAEDVPALPPSYQSTAREVAEQRVALAGYRLADQLKAIFKD
jgi:S1/P1 Nuclease